ncbi:MAG: endonuclease domain-containing protein [Patescibacteria group bacterium]
MSLIFNKHAELGKRRSLRKNMPQAEVILWARLKGSQLGGLKFRRQYGIGKFVVDFYCAQAKLVVEVDGETHIGEDAEAYDQERQKIIEQLGLRVVRVWNSDVYQNIDGVLEHILAIAQQK